MDSYEMIINGLRNQQSSNTCSLPIINGVQYIEPVNITPVNLNNSKLFTVNEFIENLTQNSINKNKSAQFHSVNINSYDIASNCIRQILFKILNYPVSSYKDVWLPVIMRAALGNAIHGFIQDNSNVFTENEVSMKVPSIRTSVRIDSLIGSDVLVEIKSCTYDDFSKIITTQKPRDADFYQAAYYRYLLHNHLEEIRSQPREILRSDPPKLDKYNISTIQILYVAHDLISSDCTSISEAVKHCKHVKKILNSKYNKFFYIYPITLDLNSIDMRPYEEYIVEKLTTINHHLNTNTIPTMNTKFICPNSCFFCLYKDVCKTI